MFSLTGGTGLQLQSSTSVEPPVWKKSGISHTVPPLAGFTAGFHSHSSDLPSCALEGPGLHSTSLRSGWWLQWTWKLRNQNFYLNWTWHRFYLLSHNTVHSSSQPFDCVLCLIIVSYNRLPKKCLNENILHTGQFHGCSSPVVACTPLQTRKAKSPLSGAVVWYVQYSHTPYSFELCMTKMKERKKIHVDKIKTRGKSSWKELHFK